MAAWPWIAISLAALLLIIVAMIWLGRERGRTRITPLAGVAFACILVGMMFESRWGYLFFAVGIVLAVADIFVQRRKAKEA